MRTYLCVIVAGLLAGWPSCVCAVESAPAAATVVRSPYLSKAMVSLQLENDFFSGVDANYTNGVSFNYISQGYNTETQRNNHSFSANMSRGVGYFLGGTGSPKWARWLCGVSDKNQRQEQWALTLTQLMYTPEDKSPDPLYNERTYAGYLGLGVGGMVKNKDRATSIELQIGATGSASLAKNTQHFVHHVLNMTQWPGWGNQTPSEVTFNLYLKRYYRLPFLETSVSADGSWSSDGFAYWHADAGTVHVRTGLGALYRIGYNLPPSSSETAIAGATFPTSPFSQTQPLPSYWSYYAYIGTAGRLVIHDIFLDGPVFHNYPSYADKNHVVMDVMAGIGLRYKNTGLVCGYLVRSKEYRKQKNWQTLGTIQFRYQF